MKSFNELKEEAKEKGITIPFRASKEDLQQLVSQNGDVEKTEPPQEVSKDIPKDLDYLHLNPVRKFTKEDVDINHFAGRKKLLDIPRHLKEQLKREGYEVVFPLDDKHQIDELRRLRGPEFVMDTDGSSIKISAQEKNERGEMQYHIAMKIKKEFLEEERRQRLKKYLSRKQKVIEGKETLGVELDADPSLMQFTNVKNKF